MIIFELTEQQKLRAEGNAWRLKARELEETVMKLKRDLWEANEERRNLRDMNSQLSQSYQHGYQQGYYQQQSQMNMQGQSQVDCGAFWGRTYDLDYFRDSK